MKDRINIEGRDGAFAAYIARPKTIPAPAVVVLQELFGVNADIRKHCRPKTPNDQGVHIEKQRNVLLSTAAYFGVMSTDARVVSQSMRRLQPLPDLS
jgi:hypothetical protein